MPPVRLECKPGISPRAWTMNGSQPAARWRQRTASLPLPEAPQPLLVIGDPGIHLLPAELARRQQLFAKG